MIVNRKSLGALAPRVKTLATALSIAIAAGGAAFVDPVSAHVTPPQASTNKANSSSKPKFHKPTYTALRNQFAALQQSAKMPVDNRTPMTRVISSNADSGSGSLREALASAVNGDVIDLHNLHGTLYLSSALQTSAMVEIRGPGRNSLTIDAGHTDRAFTASNGLRLSHVTVVNGAAPKASSNGGCLSVNGNVFLSDVTLSGCQAGDASTQLAYGGAISVNGSLYLDNVSVTNSTVTAYAVAVGGGVSVIGNTANGYYVGIYNSTISGNSAVVANSYYSYLADGGGLAVLGAQDPVANPSFSTIVSSTLSGNSAIVQTGDYAYAFAAQGGGAAFQNSVPAFTQSQVTGNSATGLGYATGSGITTTLPITLTGTNVSGNTGTSGDFAVGGGLFAVNGATIDRSTFQNNALSGYIITAGGGVYSYGTTTISNSLISGNTLTAAAGGYFSVGGGVARKYNLNVGTASLTITNSTISGNSATAGIIDIGGGVYEKESLTLNNSTIAFNNSDLYGAGVTTSKTTLITLNSTIIANNTGTVADSADLYSYGGPITAAGDHNLVIASDAGVTLPADTLTADPLLQPLADNGGGTLTHALGEASPAIDAGSNPLTLAFDQRGTPYARVVGAAADIGAFELDTDRIFANGFE